MKEEYRRYIVSAKNKQKDYHKTLQKLRKKSNSIVDILFHEKHYQVFQETDCLQCANCCKTTSPLFTQRDIQRLSKLFKVKPKTFIEQYLYIDEDDDYVLKQTPCPFLLPDNYCMIYEHRPEACRAYPHTLQRKIKQIFNLTLKNSEICPATDRILEEIHRQIS
ncbi:MAG: YkgJ family cysteine cluster protein [Bacteroidetes bacterium]|nr:MAG: YkgJ family cysteine cluster protein [Bacteroidota bacterium]